MNIDIHINKYFKAITTILELAYDRGYKNKISLNLELFKMRFNAFKNKNQGALDIHFKNYYNKLIVSFNNEILTEKINKDNGRISFKIDQKKTQELCDFLKKVNNLNQNDDIILIINNFSSTGQNMLNEQLKKVFIN